MGPSGIVVVEPSAAQAVWPEVEDWIDSALQNDYELISLEYVRSSVLAGINRLWVLEDDAGEFVGAAVTMIETFPDGKKVLGVMVAGGEVLVPHLQKWKDLMDVLDAFGYSVGASELRLVGRAAFKRIFAECGFEHRYTVLGRKIERRN